MSNNFLLVFVYFLLSDWKNILGELLHAKQNEKILCEKIAKSGTFSIKKLFVVAFVTYHTIAPPNKKFNDYEIFQQPYINALIQHFQVSHNFCSKLQKHYIKIKKDMDLF